MACKVASTDRFAATRPNSPRKGVDPRLYHDERDEGQEQGVSAP